MLSSPTGPTAGPDAHGVAAVAEPTHRFAIRGLGFPDRGDHLRGAAPTVPFLYPVPSLSRAESGARHLQSVGRLADVVHRPDNGPPWAPPACVHCGEPIRFQRQGWTHSRGWDGSELAAPEPVGETTWRCGGKTGSSWACPLLPVPCPSPRTPQETCAALLSYAVARNPPCGCRSCDAYDLSSVLEPYLRDRYAALKSSGRLFGTENRDQLDQHNRERSDTELHVANVAYRTTGSGSNHRRLPTQQMRELLELASRSPLEP